VSYIETLERVIERLDDEEKEKDKRIAELENQWISVADRLPELEDNSVLVYFTTTSIETVHIEDNFKDIPNGFDKEGNQLYTKWYIFSGITHWMPLPSPPKEQE
tara:strand:- start:207 stop:518 length:312 start_codon:yes stop_codon:yes gene_type:complete